MRRNTEGDRNNTNSTYQKSDTLEYIVSDKIPLHIVWSLRLQKMYHA